MNDILSNLSTPAHFSCLMLLMLSACQFITSGFLYTRFKAFKSQLIYYTFTGVLITGLMRLLAVLIYEYGLISLPNNSITSFLPYFWPWTKMAIGSYFLLAVYTPANTIQLLKNKIHVIMSWIIIPILILAGIITSYSIPADINQLTLILNSVLVAMIAAILAKVFNDSRSYILLTPGVIVFLFFALFTHIIGIGIPDFFDRWNIVSISMIVGYIIWIMYLAKEYYSLTNGGYQKLFKKHYAEKYAHDLAELNSIVNNLKNNTTISNNI
jgi:hypothetical protein